jgi:hypothetical protein
MHNLMALMLIYCRFKLIVMNSSLNDFHDGAVLLWSIIWTLSMVSMFYNHNVSRDGSSSGEPNELGSDRSS